MIHLCFIIFYIGTSPQVHHVRVTFVREVESRIIQDESGKDKNKNKILCRFDVPKTEINICCDDT